MGDRNPLEKSVTYVTNFRTWILHVTSVTFDVASYLASNHYISGKYMALGLHKIIFNSSQRGTVT